MLAASSIWSGSTHERRDEAHYLAPGPAGQQQQPAPRRLLLGSGGGRRIRFAVGVAELVADHQAEATHVGDLVVLVRHHLQGLVELSAALGGVLHQALVRITSRVATAAAQATALAP